jgi:hypothetical protein
MDEVLLTTIILILCWKLFTLSRKDMCVAGVNITNALSLLIIETRDIVVKETLEFGESFFVY